MKLHQAELSVPTEGRSFVEVSGLLEAEIRRAAAARGVVHALLRHTSASLILSENADPTVRADLERYFSRLVVDGDPLFRHVAEGPDDMPAHVRTVLTQNHVTLPIQDGNLRLGTWQGLFLWEHRAHGSLRQLHLSILSDDGPFQRPGFRAS